MKIEVGCGSDPSKGADYIKSDIRNLPGITYVCAAWDLDKHIQKNSVDEIFSRYLFEHFTFAQGRMALNCWYNILKSNGFCEMILPDIDVHIDLWKSGNIKRASQAFWGIQREGTTEFWDVHKSGYNRNSLYELIKSVVFKDMIDLPQDPKDIKHLHVKLIK